MCTYMCMSKTGKKKLFFFSPVFNCPIVKLTEELFPYVLNFRNLTVSRLKGYVHCFKFQRELP